MNGTAGTADADIDATEAWEVTTGSSGVTVAVIDTGVDFSHPDLGGSKETSPVMWTNPGESCSGCRTNAVDDDGNGYVDDWRGWDFVNADNDPFDDHSHGTHVAGTIGALGSNGVGVTGVNWSVKIAALKFLSMDGYGDTANAVRAILYAADEGIPITNNSWGGGEFSQALEDAIAEADRRGTLVVAAAGNDGANNDGAAHYPSNYDVPNVISVAATDASDQRAWFTNFGKESVDLGAPGVSIYSTIPGGGYDWYDGTSMATPHVSGALALAKAAFPSASALGLKALVLRSVDPIAALDGWSTTGGRLNANTVVRCAGGGQAWIESPRPGFQVAVGENIEVTAIGASCGSPTATVSATANGVPVTLTARGDGLYTGVFAPSAVGPVTLNVTAGGDTRTVSGSAKDNYRYEDAPFEWIDATAGTRTSIASDDTSVSVALPFTFDFYRQPYGSLKISSNGYLVFGSSAATAYSNVGMPNSTAPNRMVAPYWDDLNPGAGGAVWYRTTGAEPNRKFTVAWVGVPHYSCGDVTLEVTLEEGTNDIVFAYRDVVHGNANADYGASATVGVENADGTIARQFLFKQPLLQGYENAKALRFTNRAQTPPPPPDTTPPAAPAGLVATGGLRQAALDWSDNGESDLAGYRVYRNGVRVASTTASAYTDTGLADGTAYRYTVTAYDAAGNEGAASAEATATTDAPDVTPPATPTALTATASTRQVSLQWAANAESDLAGYRVYRNGVRIAQTTASSYTDAGLADGTTYRYTVTAYDRAGNESAQSAEATATTPRTPIAKTYQPSEYTIVSGSVYKNRGSVSRLYSDDGSRLEIAGAWDGSQYVSETIVRTTIAAAELATLSKLQLTFNGAVSHPSAALTLAVFDFSSGSWVVIDGPQTGVTSDRTVTWTASVPRSFASSTGEVRFSVKGTRSGSFRTETDLVRYSIEY